MRRFVALIAMLAAACATPAKPAPTLDQLGEAFVHLALEIDTHEEGFVDAYIGPPQWREAAKADPRGVEALKAEAARIESAAKAVPDAGLSPIERERRDYLAASAASARFRLEMIEGLRVPFAEEAERLFALRPEVKPLESFDPVLARIDALVPGEGPLAERVEAFRARYVIPEDKLDAVMHAAIAECRRRTAAHLTLPDNEEFRMEKVTGKSWSGYNWYQGDNKSLIQINVDLPSHINDALRLGCHEGYPGHHVQGIFAERLYKDRGWAEFSVMPLFGLQGPLNEGGGNFGLDLAFPGDERAAFETGTLYPLAGLDPATAPAYSALQAATEQLSGARLAIAAKLLDGEISRDQALALVEKYQLMSPERAERSVRFTEEYRSYVINYVSGEEVVRAFVDAAGTDPAARWAAYQRILSEPLLPADLRP